MQVTVNIEDAKLNALVEQGLESLPQEDIGNMAKEAIKKALDNPETAKSLVFRSNYGEMRLRDWLENGIRAQVSEQDISEYKNALLEVAKKEGSRLIIAAICEVITRNLFSCDNQGKFRDQMVELLRSMPPTTY